MADAGPQRVAQTAPGNPNTTTNTTTVSPDNEDSSTTIPRTSRKQIAKHGGLVPLDVAERHIGAPIGQPLNTGNSALQPMNQNNTVAVTGDPTTPTPTPGNGSGTAPGTTPGTGGGGSNSGGNLRIQITLDIEVQIELKASIKGDITLALLN